MLLGYLAGACTTLSFLPQVYRVWKTRSAGDLSYGMLGCFASGLTLWLVYGVFVESPPIVVANGVTLALVGVITFLKVRYDRIYRMLSRYSTPPGTDER